jgi:zinc/manganese transport system substrate-binding protein
MIPRINNVTSWSARGGRSVAAVVTAGALVAACGSGDGSSEEESGVRIVVTTNVLGDVVAASMPEGITVDVIMPIGADPHDFAPSARQAEAMEQADLLVVNGANFEEGMTDIVESLRNTGTEVFAFADHVDLLEIGASMHDHGEEDHDEDHGDEDHGEEDHDEDHGDEDHAHEAGSADPHLWTDPDRIAAGVTALVGAVSLLEGVDADAVEASAASYLSSLEELAGAMSETLSVVAQQERVLVTNHEVFAYFAERFDFEVVGAVIPSTSTGAEPSASDLDDLAEIIIDEGVPAVFAETSGSTRLAEVLVDEIGGDVAVIELFTESLGDDGSGAATYLEMMRFNAAAIAGALAPE